MRGVRRAAGDAQRARRAMRGGLVVGARTSADWLYLRDALRGRCIARCAEQSLHGMRCADWLHLRDALRGASWWHSRGAGGTMLLTEGF